MAAVLDNASCPAATRPESTDSGTLEEGGSSKSEAEGRYRSKTRCKGREAASAGRYPGLEGTRQQAYPSRIPAFD